MQHLQDLTRYSIRRGSLKITVINLDMNDAEIQAFLASIEDQEDILSELMNNTEAFDALQKIAERFENQNNRDVQISVTSQAAAVREAIRSLNSRYLADHETVMNISTKLGLDTAQYQETRAEVQKLIGEIQATELRAADPASLQESRITLLVEPGQATYRDTVQIFGLVSPAGKEQDSIPSSRWPSS